VRGSGRGPRPFHPEPGDDVRPEPERRDASRDLERPGAIRLTSVPPAHPAQDGIRAALKRHVEVGCDPAAGRGQGLEERVIDLARLDAAEPEPHVGHSVQETRQKSAQRGAGIEIAAVMPDVNPGEHELRMVQRQRPRLRDDLVGLPGPAHPSGQPRRAERALAVASILDRDPTARGADPPREDLTTHRLHV